MSEAKEPTKEEVAQYIKAIWGALIEPKWSYDDLVTLGKMVYAKVPLSKIDPEIMKILLPKLAAIARKVAVDLHVGSQPSTTVADKPESA